MLHGEQRPRIYLNQCVRSGASDCKLHFNNLLTCKRMTQPRPNTYTSPSRTGRCFIWRKIHQVFILNTSAVILFPMPFQNRIVCHSAWRTKRPGDAQAQPLLPSLASSHLNMRVPCGIDSGTFYIASVFNMRTEQFTNRVCTINLPQIS